MNRKNYLFTSESVSEGHPDKVCDQISDAILDAFLAEEPETRLACETLAVTNRVVLAGEFRGPKKIFDNMEEIARETVRDIGYEQAGFHWQNFAFDNYMHEQSPDIAVGVDASGDKAEGAGDQGLMFGFAVDETPEMMPAAIYFSHALMRKLAEDRKSGRSPQLGPDAKCQLTIRYIDGQPVGVASLVLSTQHIDPDLNSDEIREIVTPAINTVIPDGWIDGDTVWHINPTGRFVVGGPDGDAGLTGRKIIVDTYGGASPHGGGAFSGKDPTKVDRSASYAARYLAKNIVSAGLARKCSIQLAYAIGIAEPLSVSVDTYSTGKIPDHELERIIGKLMDLTPKGIRTHLFLNSPIYRRTAAYGHFGRAPTQDGGFSWEKTDLVDKLKNLA